MPLSRLTGNSFNATANTNIDNGLLFLNPTTNRVGVNVTNPGYPLDIATDAASQTVRFRGRAVDNTTRMDFFNNGANTAFGGMYSFNNEIGLEASQAGGEISFRTGGSTDRVRISNSGNIGVANTPSPWGSGYRSLDMRNGGAGFAASDEASIVSSNAYHDGSNWKYKITSGGSWGSAVYSQFAGAHTFHSASSGTAGGTISFSERARINGTGLGVAQSNPSFLIDAGNNDGTVAPFRSQGSFLCRKYSFGHNASGVRTLRFTLTVNGLQFVNVFLDCAGHRFDNGGSHQSARIALQFMCENTTVRLNQRMPNYEYGGSSFGVFSVGSPPSWTFTSGNICYFDFTVAQNHVAYISVLVEGPGIQDATITQIS